MYESVLDLPLLHRGKVRELYALDPDRLLMVATDHISAFDFVLASPVPDKGAILTQLSSWWFAQLTSTVENHLVPAEVPGPVRGRAVVCERLSMIPVECVARGYLTGSGWEEYVATGEVCGVALPAGLVSGARLPEPIFTPTTKAPLGEHDEHLTYADVEERLGPEVAGRIRDLTLEVYRRAETIARDRGLIVADTKLEFGRRADGTIVLADEVLTPDSSRFWDAADWQPGAPPRSFDKQFVRDWLQHESGWDRTAGELPPPLPEPVVAATRERYVAAYERLTGTAFS